MNSIRFIIDGLEQNETQERVKNQLEGIIGVNEVCMSTGQTYVDVNYDDQTSRNEINNHLQNNGYKVIDVDEFED
jgi:copper chaperone CopZ